MKLKCNVLMANRQSFAEDTERQSACLPDPDSVDVDTGYVAYCKVLLGAARKNHPPWFNVNYIRGWDEECSHLLHVHQQASSREEVDESATALLQKLDATRRSRWTEVVESIDFTHSRRKAWRTINQLTGRTPSVPKFAPTANAIVSQLLKNGCFPSADKDFAHTTSQPTGNNILEIWLRWWSGHHDASNNMGQLLRTISPQVCSNSKCHGVPTP